MENKGLLFIPDISGFTQFVNETDIEHSRLIIEELLELLINAYEIGLEVSEIEGDAILFYKFGESPDLKELYKQVKKMFCEFHKSLAAYDVHRYCQCKACISAINLTLKIITHYGEFTSYSVKKFNKLIGKDLIIAHQLLKNDIEKHEYWLVTKKLLHNDEPANLTNWMTWSSSAKRTESGEITFSYTPLSELKNEIPPQFQPQLDLSKKVKMMSLSKEYITDVITLAHATGDFNYRHRWQEGVKSIEEVGHFLPRVGMRCRYTMENGQASIYSSSYSFMPGRVEFSEINETDESTTYYILEKIDKRNSRLTLVFYIKRNIVSQIIFNLTRKEKQENILRNSLHNLDKLVNELNYQFYNEDF